MIDLHTHSCFSDGTDTPAELLAVAANAGLKAVALTDHDTAEGVTEFLAAAAEHPEIEAIPGVEFSCLYGARELHFLGLYIDVENPALRQFMTDMRQSRQMRAEEMLRKINSLGFELSAEELALAGALHSVGRPHFAAALLKKFPDRFKSWDDVFAKLLKKGSAAYVPRKLPMVTDVLQIIRAAGGIAIWAHPVYRNKNERAFVRRFLKRFAPEGIDGLETYYSLYSPVETEYLTQFAADFNLAGSGGSDYHGKNSPEINLGTGCGYLKVPDGLLDQIKERKASKYELNR